GRVRLRPRWKNVPGTATSLGRCTARRTRSSRGRTQKFSSRNSSSLAWWITLGAGREPDATQGRKRNHHAGDPVGPGRWSPAHGRRYRGGRKRIGRDRSAPGGWGG